MKKRMVEIIGNHPSLLKGSKRLLPITTCKGLIKAGMAKYADEEVPVSIAPDFKEAKEEETNLKPNNNGENRFQKSGGSKGNSKKGKK